MEYFDVIIEHLNTQKELKIVIDVDEAEESELIVLHTILNREEIVSSDPCYFTSFQNFRDYLLKLGYGMKCKGAYVNAVQSPMMCICDSIYLVSMGKQALMKDAVGMFEYADIHEFCSSKEQIEYFVSWCESIMPKE